MQFFVADTVENIANIGEKERRKRLVWGIAALILGAAGAVFLVMSEVSMWWRLVLFIPFFGGFLGYFQEMEKT